MSASELRCCPFSDSQNVPLLTRMGTDLVASVNHLSPDTFSVLWS